MGWVINLLDSICWYQTQLEGSVRNLNAWHIFNVKQYFILKHLNVIYIYNKNDDDESGKKKANNPDIVSFVFS